LIYPSNAADCRRRLQKPEKRRVMQTRKTFNKKKRIYELIDSMLCGKKILKLQTAWSFLEI
jgi:hypothetical protein